MALDGLLRTRAAVVQGIVNGIDDDGLESRPPTPRCRRPIARCASTCAVRNKAALQTRIGLTPGASRPLFGVVSRLSDQKGLDLLLQALPGSRRRGGQLALLGSGEPALEQGFAAAAAARAGARSAASSATTRRSPISSRPAPISSSCRRASSPAG